MATDLISLVISSQIDLPEEVTNLTANTDGRDESTQQDLDADATIEMECGELFCSKLTSFFHYLHN